MGCTQEEQRVSSQEASPIPSKEEQEVFKEEMKSTNNKSCNNSSSTNCNNSLLTAALTSTVTTTTKQMRRLNKQKKTLYMCKWELVKPLRHRRNFGHLLKRLVIPSVESVQLEILQHQRERKHLLHKTELHEIFVTENVKRVVLDFDNTKDNNVLSTPNSTCTELQYTAEPIPPELATEELKQKKQSKPVPISVVVSAARKSIQGDDLTIESKPYSSSFPPMTEEGRDRKSVV